MKASIAELNLLYVTDRSAWRAWLEQNYRHKKEIWLVFNKKHTGKASVLYNDAVEEALCFGWIDSIVRSLDAERFAQRFSKRNPKTPYSQTNKERLRQLVEQGRVMPEVFETIEDALQEAFIIPSDILDAIQANPDAWKNF